MQPPRRVLSLPRESLVDARTHACTHAAMRSRAHTSHYGLRLPVWTFYLFLVLNYLIITLVTLCD